MWMDPSKQRNEKMNERKKKTNALSEHREENREKKESTLLTFG